MACNENIIKNMANEITRNCQAQSVSVDADFVVYIIELLLLNPKYGNRFVKTLNRNSLEYFVNECVNMLIESETPIHTMRMQYILQTNYDKLPVMIDRHLDTIDQCLRPLVNEILEEHPQDEAAFMKLFRKISIFIILSSGLGNPGVIVTLKEGMAALESVFTAEDLKVFLDLPRLEKLAQLRELVEIVSGVRLFNRDCKKGGDGIPDLTFDIIDAGKASIVSLSQTLIAVMQRVNSLTTAVADAITIQDETGNILINVADNSNLESEHYVKIFQLITFYRQYEMYLRRLIGDVEVTVESATQSVDRLRRILEDLHAAVKYKTAVPVTTVYPLFKKLWATWRTMQNIMYLVSTVNKLTANMSSIQEQVKIPCNVLDRMLRGKLVVSDQERMNWKLSKTDRMYLGTLKNYVTQDSTTHDKCVQYLGFCALCLSVGALVPSNNKVGHIKLQGQRYGFCNANMARRFSKDPQRYINEVLHYARNNPHVINLLSLKPDVTAVRGVDNLVTKYEPKIKVLEKDIQTDTHPIETYIEKDYTWDLWEWKRRACQWASIVNCQTHSTQTHYSHLRSEISCQTVEPRDKWNQTKRDQAVDTLRDHAYLWGLRDGAMRVWEGHTEKSKIQQFDVCGVPNVLNQKAPTKPISRK